MKDVSDRIEKQIRLKAPRTRVWQAIVDSRQFGEWFGVKLEGPWEVGRAMRGTFDMNFSQDMIDEALAAMNLPSAPIASRLPEVFCTVEEIVPEQRFSFRWIPYGLDAGIDPETEPTTLVEFHLQEDGEGTLLFVTESGFDKVPLARRRRAFLMNTGGWAAQLDNIAKYLQSSK